MQKSDPFFQGLIDCPIFQNLNYLHLVEDLEAKLNSEQKLPFSRDEQMQIIKDYVKAYQMKNKINPTIGRKFELSCEAFGEGRNLLYCQLVPTVDGMYGWMELEGDSKFDHEVREMVISEIKRDFYLLKK